MKKLTAKNNQQGAVIVFTTIGLTLFMGMAGLALDLSHTELNKTRFQNAVDASALAGANVLNDQLGALTGTPTSAQITAAKAAAQTKIINVFSANTGTGINSQLNQTIPALTNSNIAFSNTLFGPDTGTPLYVRVTSPTVGYPSWFMQVWEQNTKNVSASAVAGVSPNRTCIDNIAPIMLCQFGPKDDGADADTTANNAGVGTWGYDFDKRIRLNPKPNGSGAIISGNFMFLDLGCGGNNSASCLQDQLAGAGKTPTLCVGNSATLGTNPGNMAGPSADGLNTRFGIYDGSYGGGNSTAPVDFPPDTNQACYDLSTISTTSHNNYINRAIGIDDPNGNSQGQGQGNTEFCDIHKSERKAGNSRRELIVPIADCSLAAGNGNTTVPIVDIGCIFLDVPADHTNKKKYCGTANSDIGCDDDGKEISGRLTKNCSVYGVASNTAPTGSFAHKTVQLYKNPGSNDS